MRTYSRTRRLTRLAAALMILVLGFSVQPTAARTAKPPLHGRHWMAITGKPLAERGARGSILEQTTTSMKHHRGK